MVLKHRDTDVLRFEWTGMDGVKVTEVNSAALKYLPLEMRGEATDERLWSWIVHRTVPKHRKYIHGALLKLGLNPRNIEPIVRFCRGLSLNDVHWVVDDGFPGKWKDYNLYDNEFDEAIALLAFSGVGFPEVEKWTTSPEFTTNGMLAKCWRRIRGEVQLFKGGLEGAANVGFEPYSEFYASQVARAMGLEHVEYGLSKFKGRLCSTCPLFTSDRFGYVPAGRLLDSREALADPRFSDVFLFDAVIFNTDRHMGNFGYLVDNDSNEIVGAAPIFDNGYGLFSLALDRPDDARNHEFDDLRKFVNHVQPALYGDWLGFPGALDDRMLEKVRRLRGFRFHKHHRYNLSTDRLTRIEDFLQNRVSQILQYGVQADELLKLPHKSEPVIPVRDSTDDPVGADSLGVQIMENMRADPFISREELADMMQVSLSTIKRKIVDLREQGKIDRQGSDRKGTWVVL